VAEDHHHLPCGRSGVAPQATDHAGGMGHLDGGLCLAWGTDGVCPGPRAQGALGGSPGPTHINLLGHSSQPTPNGAALAAGLRPHPLQPDQTQLFLGPSPGPARGHLLGWGPGPRPLSDTPHQLCLGSCRGWPQEVCQGMLPFCASTPKRGRQPETHRWGRSCSEAK
jgi:hypothetical protein